MDQLSSIALERHPHFRIVPPARSAEAPKLWDIEARNEIGFIIDDKNTSNKTYRTYIKFLARVGLTDFVKCVLMVEKKTGQRSLKVRLNLDGNNLEPEFPEGRVTQLQIPLISGNQSKGLSIRLIKDVKQSARSNQILFKLANETAMVSHREGQRTFDFGNLLDIAIQETADGPIVTKPEEIKGYGLLPVEVDQNKSTAKVRFRDYHISTTQIPNPKRGTKTIADVSREYKGITGRDVDTAVRSYVETKIESEGGRLYEFQSRAVLNIGLQLYGDRKPCLVIARTATGKTEAFLIPIIDWIIQRENANKAGVKALFFYPTKALAADQLQRIVEFLHYVNRTRKEHPISVGVYHGDIEEQASLNIPLPLRCVLHEDDIASGRLKSGQVRLRQDADSKNLRCPICKEDYPFVVADRYSVTLKLPDILVCTPDVVNYILMRDKKRHVFLGCMEPVTVCQDCRRIVADEERCKVCGKATTEVEAKINETLQIVLLDELHLFASIFGGNVSNLLRRLSAAVSEYSIQASHDQPRIQYIATSATVRNPSEFGKEFFGTEVSLTETTKDDYDYTNRISKAVVFSAPRAFKMLDSISYTLYEMLRSTDIRILVFVNSLSQCGMLLSNVRQRLSSDKNTAPLVDRVDGHNSTYTKQERAEAEEKFNRGELRALIATGTLEVGVDFKDLNGLMLYGAPPSFNNYLQRIGRVGRRNDAIIFNFLNLDDPIDLFYYRNAINLAQDPTEFVEYPPFPAGNEILAQKHVLSSIFDACTVLRFDPAAELKLFKTNPDGLSQPIRKYVKAMWNDADIQEASRTLRAATVAVQSDSSLPVEVLKKFNLQDLRKVEDTIKVEFDEPYGTQTGTRPTWRGYSN